ncbi:MAG: hypothetical protein K9K37_13465 [Desulfocapsa sp.]|nr:hypothetical protein [Desulfocapsa sp.]
MNRFSIFILIILVFISTNNALSQQEQKLQKNGYEIDVIWKEKNNNELELSGKIVGGNKNCNKLNFEFYIKNSFSGESVRFGGFLFNYRPEGKNNFKISRKIDKASTKAYHEDWTKQSWFLLDSYTLDCWNWNSRLRKYHAF